MKVLITGGSGRLGRSVVAGFAAAGHDVISVDRSALPAGPEFAGVQQENVDLLDGGQVRSVFGRLQPDAVIHLAAIAVPFSAPEEVILRTNTLLAYNVMGAATELGVRYIVTASSPTVLGYGAPGGWLPKRFPLDEDSTPQPWNAYALSKLIAEQVMRMFVAEGTGSSRYAAFRPCYVISPEEWQGALTQQGHTVLQRLQDPALSAPALFNYVDARDVADFLAVLLDRLDSVDNGQTFFVGAADALAAEPLATLMPRFLPGSDELAAGLTGTNPAFSIAKAERMLGWKPARSWRTELEDPWRGNLVPAAAQEEIR
ncbi:MAG: oxidoreductase [Micrococcaceae bacterium]|nr:oxidoreductase [Micrococcaceae bacterium]